ncbi:hypothetical protein ABPG72_007102 [Tetrahymena utriculariae]
MYIRTISVGKGKKNLKVILSTGFNKLMLPSKNCDKNNCNGFEKYYEYQSQDGCNPTNNQGSQKYLDSSFTGNYVNTLVSISNLESIQQSVNGVLGLGVYNIKNDDNNSFVTSLYKKGLIKENMFSFYLGFKNDDSKLTLGGIDPKNLVGKAYNYTLQVIQNDQKDLQKWVLEISQFSVGYFTHIFNSTWNKTLVDSSYPYFGFEQSIYDKISQQFLKRNVKITKNKGLYVNCKDLNLATMYFYLREKRPTFKPLDLPIDFYLSNTTSDCQVLISPITNNQNFCVILGSPFLRRYVSSYSYSDQSISFIQSIADPKDDTSTDFSLDGFPTWPIVVIVIVANKQLGNALKELFASNTSAH